VGGFSGPVPEEIWTVLRSEFGLPSLEQVQTRLSGLADPESILRSLVRVFIDDGTFCPGFQFRPASSSITASPPSFRQRWKRTCRTTTSPCG
jgi:hypothetical protein